MKNRIIFLGFLTLALAGCATSSSYLAYTAQHFPPKDPSVNINVYPHALPVTNPYYVIGKVAIEGFASDGVGADTLTRQAMSIARKRGADAIINAKTVVYHYYGGDALVRFKGELIVYSAK